MYFFAMSSHFSAFILDRDNDILISDKLTLSIIERSRGLQTGNQIDSVFHVPIGNVQ